MYRLIDSTGQTAGEVDASSTDEAFRVFVAENAEFFDTRRGPCVERYTVVGPDGSATHRWYVADQDEPPCVRGAGEHAWGRARSWGRGAGVVTRTTCARCGVVREEADNCFVIDTIGETVSAPVVSYRRG